MKCNHIAGFYFGDNRHFTKDEKEYIINSDKQNMFPNGYILFKYCPECGEKL